MNIVSWLIFTVLPSVSAFLATLALLSWPEWRGWPRILTVASTTLLPPYYSSTPPVVLAWAALLSIVVASIATRRNKKIVLFQRGICTERPPDNGWLRALVIWVVPFLLPPATQIEAAFGWNGSLWTLPPFAFAVVAAVALQVSSSDWLQLEMWRVRVSLIVTAVPSVVCAVLLLSGVPGVFDEPWWWAWSFAPMHLVSRLAYAIYLWRTLRIRARVGTFVAMFGCYVASHMV